ncbi:hypothetical protein PG995_005335 [Apiospora arundinis]
MQWVSSLYVTVYSSLSDLTRRHPSCAPCFGLLPLARGSEPSDSSKSMHKLGVSSPVTAAIQQSRQGSPPAPPAPRITYLVSQTEKGQVRARRGRRRDDAPETSRLAAIAGVRATYELGRPKVGRVAAQEGRFPLPSVRNPHRPEERDPVPHDACLPTGVPASGLVNDYTHIRGDVVINHMFCSGKEHNISHHKAIRNAESALHALGQWMDGGGRDREPEEGPQRPRHDLLAPYTRPLACSRTPSTEA